MLEPVFIVVSALAYLLGAIPFGYLLARYVKGVDIRQHGSGNIGATNAVRVAGKGIGAATLLADVFKGWFPSFTALYLGFTPIQAVIVGFLSFVGHVFSVFLKFKGGKGVATWVGVFLALQPKAGLLAALIYGGLLTTLRISAVASLTAVCVMPLMLYFFSGLSVYLYLSLFMMLIIVLRHRGNIRSLLAEREKTRSSS